MLQVPTLGPHTEGGDTAPGLPGTVRPRAQAMAREAAGKGAEAADTGGGPPGKGWNLEMGVGRAAESWSKKPASATCHLGDGAVGGIVQSAPYSQTERRAAPGSWE